MSPTPTTENKRGPRSDRPARLLAALQQAGNHGLSPTALAAIIGLHSSTTQLRNYLQRLGTGAIFALKHGTCTLYFHGSTHPKEAAARHAQYAQTFFDARTAKRLATMGLTPNPARQRSLGTPPRHCTRLRAVDPDGLRRDAKVTVPEGLQIQVCPAGQDTRHSPAPNHRGALKALPLGQYEVPPSPWAQAVSQRAAA